MKLCNLCLCLSLFTHCFAFCFLFCLFTISKESRNHPIDPPIEVQIQIKSKS